MAKKPVKKRKKAHNMRARYIRQAHHTTEKYNLAIFYSYNHGCKSHLVDDKNLHRLRPSNMLVDMLRTVRYRWGIYLGVLCEASDGERYLKGAAIEANEPYLQSELADFLESEHAKVIEGCNKEHVRNVVWLASPTGRDYTEKEAYSLFETFGAWEEVLTPQVGSD